MFTVQQVKAAHAKVKSGKDFPAYVQEIKALGLTRYEFFVADGRTVYYGKGGYTLATDSIYSKKPISDKPAPATVRETIAEHQQGKSDFLTFCQLVAQAGVHKWVIDTNTMLCTYYSINGESMVAEPIPQAGY